MYSARFTALKSPPNSEYACDVARRVAQVLCYIALLFASADVWPVLTIGFTFRLAQPLLILCIPLLLPILWREPIRTFPGSAWCLLLVIWSIVILPFSLLFDRSLGYTFWLANNLLIVFIFVQTFRSSIEIARLVDALLISYSALSIFGLVQLLAGMAGIDLLVTEWWYPGKLPRINGLSYEPSFYATYLINGWVLSNYLVADKRSSISPRLLRLCAVLTSVALFASTSRLGWGLMLAWSALRAVLRLATFLSGGKSSRRLLRRRIVLGFLISTVAVTLGISSRDKIAAAINSVSFLITGLGVFGASAISSETRINGALMTWNAFLAHPLIGSGLGAVPVEIASQLGLSVTTLDDAKQNEANSVLLEILASFGLAGSILIVGFFLRFASQIRAVQPYCSEATQSLIRGMMWALLWSLLALQFNQNFLRIYVWMDVAILVCIVSGAMPRGNRVHAIRDSVS